MKTISNKKFMNKSQAARYFSVSFSTIKYWIKENIIDHTDFGNDNKLIPEGAVRPVPKKPWEKRREKECY